MDSNSREGQRSEIIPAHNGQHTNQVQYRKKDLYYIYSEKTPQTCFKSCIHKQTITCCSSSGFPCVGVRLIYWSLRSTASYVICFRYNWSLLLAFSLHFSSSSAPTCQIINWSGYKFELQNYMQINNICFLALFVCLLLHTSQTFVHT